MTTAVLSRHPTFAGIVLDPDRCIMSSSRGRIQLAADTARVAAQLMAEPGVTVAAADLIAAMSTRAWSGPEARLRECVTSLRHALAVLGSGSVRIVGDSARGYAIEGTAQ